MAQLSVWDTLSNLISGLGGVKDKASYDQFYLSLLSKDQLETAYRSDWIARKVVDIPPHDETRKGREWQAKNAQIEAIEALEKQLGFWGKLAQARRMARLYGGAALVMGMKDGQHDEPLDLEQVRKGDIQYLLAFSCFELTAGEIDRQFDSPNFGKPKTYQVATAETPVDVHHSRVIRFVGAELPHMDSNALVTGWGDSVIQACYDAIHDASLVAQGTAVLVQDARLDVIKVPDLSKHMQTDAGTTLIQNRFTNANKLKSLINTLVLDKEEEWDRIETSFSQLPELMDRYLQIAAGAADIPATRLLGQAPQGMNATGDGDYKNYLDRIGATQEIEIRPALEPLDEVMIRSALGARPDEIHYKWSPLWQLSEKEQADIFKTKADAARTIAGKGQESPLMPIEVISEGLSNELIEDGSLAGLEAAIKRYGYITNEEPDDEDDALLADAEPRTLYISRKVVNADEIIAWAKEQGFETTLPADDLHVTVAYSKTPVDWMKVGENWAGSDRNGNLEIPPGGARMMDRFDGGAVVLMFASSELSWRHEVIKERGASWDWPEFQPHITITYDGPQDLKQIEPYRGRIVLGPEIFAEIDDGWKSAITEE